MPGRSRAITLYVDGASRGNPGPSGIGIVVKDRHGKVIKEIPEYIGRFTNNVAEYRALLRALEEAKEMGATDVVIRSDSELLISQLDGSYKVKSPDLTPLYLEATRLLRGFRWSAERVPRGQNAAADALANRAIDRELPESHVEFSVLLERRGGEFVARVPALPGAEGRGKTRSEALEAARAAVIEQVKGLRARGRPVPKEERIRVRIAGADID